MQLLFIFNGRFPNSSAYASRLSNFIRLFNSIGIDVHLIVDDTDKRELLDGGQGKFESATYQVIGDSRSVKARLTNPRLCFQETIRYIESRPVDVVMLNSCYDRFRMLFPELKKRKIPVILESCEWVHHTNWRGGWLNPFFIQYWICMQYHFNKVDGVVAISRLLAEHYRQFTPNVIRIPSILNVVQTPCSLTTENESIELMYAGSPGRSKEMLDNIIRALYNLGEDRRRFSFSIYGINRRQLETQLGKEAHLLDQILDCVHIRGTVPQTEIWQKYQKSDFGIFLRPERRSSHAGFPTKLAECMTAGTPVICNDTGDIGLYLVNRSNGFLLPDSRPQTLEDTLREVIKLSREQRIALRRAARATAEASFDYRGYSQDMAEFVGRVCGLQTVQPLQPPY